MGTSLPQARLLNVNAKKKKKCGSFMQVSRIKKKGPCSYIATVARQCLHEMIRRFAWPVQ